VSHTGDTEGVEEGLKEYPRDIVGDSVGVTVTVCDGVGVLDVEGVAVGEVE